MLRRLSLATCLLITGMLKAQPPAAAFTASRVSGCAPLSVSFTDQSTGDPKYWNWDFGNGQLSSLQNPSTSYSAPGTYTVQLVVRNPDGTNGITKTDYITVFPSPSANFTADMTTACAPAVIQFTDRSASAPDRIVSWNWDFGNGESSALQNPSRAYSSAGYNDVALTVTSENGCSSKANRPRFIRIINGITPEFDYTRSGSCALPVSSTFINNTSGPGTLTYHWSFSDGQQSTEKNPVISFPDYGAYTVNLSVSSSFGCEGSISKPVSFAANDARIVAPASACPDLPIRFSNGSATIPLSTNWDFGDGTVSDEPTPLKAYPVPGAYTITLVSVYPECTSTVTQTILITAAPTVDFTVDNAGACKIPAEIRFHDASATDAVSWLWDFGDGQRSTEKDPVHTYAQTGSYTVKLSITTSGGCSNTLTRQNLITITEGFELSIHNGRKEGCLPLTFSPTASVNTPDGIASYLWDFGNGVTSTAGSPVTTYNTAGTYTVKLKVQTNAGCVDSAIIVNGVRTGAPPVAAFDFASAGGCAGSPIQFNDRSAPANEWLWDFGDGTRSTDANPSHQFSDTGYLTVKLTAFNNGCGSSVSQITPHIEGPVARFKARVTCATPASSRLTVKFDNQSIVVAGKEAVTGYLWEFGSSGIPNSTLKDPPDVTYPSTGDYTVTLTVKDDICSYTLPLVIRLDAQTADFTVSQPAICRGAPFRIETKGIDSAQIAAYSWKIGSDPPFNGTAFIDTNFTRNGTYPVTLTIIDTFGCSSTKTVNDAIKIVGAFAGFSTPGSEGCLNAPLNFTDESTGDPVSKWTFDYGDGTVETYTSPPFTHSYSDSGSYAIRLTVGDSYGCTNSIRKTSALHISKSIAGFGAAATLFCPGGDLQFTDSSHGNNLTYRWDFGDGTLSSDVNPVHRYQGGDSLYTVKLTVTDAAGCTDSATRSGYIRIVAPKPALNASDTISLCPPLQAFFYSSSKDYESLYWDFGDGSLSTLDTISHFYNNYGQFTAKLYTVGYGGCLDSALQTIRVLNPSVDARLTFSPLEACNSLNVGFNISVPPDIKFILSFGDGAADSSNTRQLSHFYQSPNLYRPALALEDSVGCRVSIGGPGTIKINGSLPLFNMDKKAFCDNGTVFFTNFTIGNDPIVSRSWDFGDGSTSPEVNPSHTFTAPDTYIVAQNVVTASGCQSSFYDTVRVYGTPRPVITSPDEICIGDSLFMQSGTVRPDTAISLQWETGSLSSADPVLNLLPGDTGTFQVRLKAENLLGCSSDTTKTIRVNPLPVITLADQLTTPVGVTVTVPVTYNDPNLVYAWSPATYLSCTNCATPQIVQPRFSTTYMVKVTDVHQCKSADSIRLITVCNDLNYFMPNTFSPNGDGENDWFYPRGSFINKIQSLRIFNRWGEMVFEKKNFAPNNKTDGWNGFYKGKPAGQDAYVYILELICENAQIVAIKGNVTLIR